jgi:hypothetical protein
MINRVTTNPEILTATLSSDRVATWLSPAHEGEGPGQSPTTCASPWKKMASFPATKLNGSTTIIIAVLMVFLVQNLQNRHAAAIRINLYGLIRATQGGHIG